MDEELMRLHREIEGLELDAHFLGITTVSQAIESRRKRIAELMEPMK